MQVATSFLQGHRAPQIKTGKNFPQAETPEGVIKQNFKKGGGFRSQHKTEKRPDRFTLLTKTPKEILALEKGKFKSHLRYKSRKQIEDMLKAGKLVAHNPGAKAKQRKKNTEKKVKPLEEKPQAI
ncbi:hypothetical protein Tco_0963809 [Tanacetum coccineum]